SISALRMIRVDQYHIQLSRAMNTDRNRELNIRSSRWAGNEGDRWTEIGPHHLQDLSHGPADLICLENANMHAGDKRGQPCCFLVGFEDQRTCLGDRQLSARNAHVARK